MLDGRTQEAWAKNPRPPKSNSLTPEERQAIKDRYVEKDVINLSLNQAYLVLLDKGEYYGSQSTVYRVMRKEGLVTARNGCRTPRKVHKPTSFEATGPNQVWTWDITYVKDARYPTQYFYVYVVVDIFSRYVVHSAVYERDCAEYACEFLDAAFKKHHIKPRQLVLHSDNGSSMKAAQTLALLDKRKVQFSHSRPRVSNDNPYSEALFKTLKYTGTIRYPHAGFESIEAARRWLGRFITRYNNEHYHCGIKFVTPAMRFKGVDKEVLEKRRLKLEEERRKHPDRWIQGHVQDCTPAGSVWLNPSKAADAVDGDSAQTGSEETVLVVEPCGA